jgi:hypothetical protein
MTPCASCASRKAKQQCIPKKSERVCVAQPGERWYHDIPKIVINRVSAVPRSDGICNMMNLVGTPFSNFYKHKDNFIEPMCALLHKLSDKRMTVEYIWMDNSGENKKVVELATGANSYVGVHGVQCTSAKWPC